MQVIVGTKTWNVGGFETQRIFLEVAAIAGQAGVEPQLAMKLLPEIWNNGLTCLGSPEISFLRRHSPLACAKSDFREWHA